MSKNRKRMNLPRIFANNSVADKQSDYLKAEYSVIQSDLVRLVVLNAVILVLVVALFYYDKQSGILQELFSKLF